MRAVIYRFVAVGRCAGAKVFTDKKENITDKYKFFGLSVIKRRNMEEKKVGRNKSGRFTKGNNFAKGEGSPSKYKKEYAEGLINFFKNCTDYPTFEGYAAEIGVVSRTLENWKERYPSFADAYERAQDIQKNKLIVKALNGNYNGNFAKFIASVQFGMTEKSEQKITGIEGIDLNIELLQSGEKDKVK